MASVTFTENITICIRIQMYTFQYMAASICSAGHVELSEQHGREQQPQTGDFKYK